MQRILTVDWTNEPEGRAGAGVMLLPGVHN
jgi:hypothetical protein